MRLERGSWWSFLSRALVLGGVITGVVFLGHRLANAGPGEPVRRALTVSGVLSGAPSSATATFRFYRAAGDTTPLCAPEVSIRDGMERDASTGAFSVEVPLDQSGHACPDTLFHDPSAFVEIAIGAATVVSRRPINPVPYAVYAQQYGTPDCPTGFERVVDATQGFPEMSEKRLCVRSDPAAAPSGNPYDQVVRVGSGATAFWIDRYEASVWSERNGSNDRREPYFTMSASDYPNEFPPNGQWTRRLYAFSRQSWNPARYITWFQASEACRASGKRLPTGDEWLTAARGTPDTITAGTGGTCVTASTQPFGVSPRTRCESLWGSQDMIGNFWEWTAEWYAGLGNADTETPSTDGSTGWPPDDNLFGGDGTANIASSEAAGIGSGSRRVGIPAAAIRGGAWSNAARAGVFALHLNVAPTGRDVSVGFRCVIPR